MATVGFSAKYRPIKVAFLVRKGELADLTKAAGLNSFLWGGIYNPIIPIAPKGEDNSMAEYLIRTFSPDTLYKVAETEEINTFALKYKFLRDPGHYADKIFYEDWHSKKNVIGYLDSFNVMARYWEEEFKHSSPKQGSNCKLPVWEEADSLNTVFSINFGFYPNTYNLKYDFNKAFLGSLRGREVIIRNGESLRRIIGTSIVPISLTGLDIKNYGGSFRDRNGIFFGERDNFEHLVYFWNLRASTGSNLIYCPLEEMGRFDAVIRGYFSWFDSLPPSRPNEERMISIYYTNSTEEIQTIIERFPTKSRKGLSSYQPKFITFEPTNNYFDWQTATGFIDQSFNKYQVNISYPEKKFLPKKDARKEIDQQYLAINLDSYGDSGYPSHTLKLPFLPELSEFFSREIAVDPWQLRVHKDGISLLIRARDENDTLYPLEHRQLMDKVYEYCGIKATTSQAGLLTSKIITGMREHLPLEACRVFMITGVRRLIKSLKAEQRIRWNQAIRVIWDEEKFKKFENLYIESRDTKKLHTIDAFNFLVKKKLFKPELRLWYKLIRTKKGYKCQGCGLNTNVLLTNYENDKWPCPYCFEEQDLRPLVIKEFRDKPHLWNYKKSGLLSKDNSQEGALPVVLSLLTFSRILHHDQFVYTNAFNLKVGSKLFETDFTIFHYGRNEDELEVAIAEVKDEGGEINTNDINNLKLAREKITEKGLSCFLVFAKTADSFSEEEIGLFKALKAEKIPFILLTNKEMEKYHPYWENDDTDKLPQKYAQTMSEMAQNSYFRYTQ